MAAAQSPSLIHQYSSVYTRLQEGKRELIGFGMDRVLLNRFITDSAETTSQANPEPVLATVNPDSVSEGQTSEEKIAYCRQQLNVLIGMQEEVNTLQKVARESGIGAGLLTIVGQASVQSPNDNGASVIQQLNVLLNGSDGSAGTQTQVMNTVEESATIDTAANNPAAIDFDRLSALQKLVATVLEHKSAIGVDVLVCFIASCLAIKLVS